MSSSSFSESVYLAVGMVTLKTYVIIGTLLSRVDVLDRVMTMYMGSLTTTEVVTTTFVMIVSPSWKLRMLLAIFRLRKASLASVFGMGMICVTL